ncbi:hypothetical protein H9Q69_010379 [Fusarium xylarioides]|uniref:C2H2-type domain-containing protein n=1 Tax=Fusarium xylarioides TaxID=221167 RepID=A0A9P7HYI8_9HYPO|nr:hypothetical protein H9Q70_006340 [Fusarium xylarioides]KAG5764180.1 hypothetical protein H9Q72_007755 [Fusarium xylarioides]KAG5782405.1 hypothetical protein H9Q73_003963 [Fusarium xylarioides]KAG5790569.1 hypothetical protein H9Q69_010379 [Fusarium xylarioides]KAG5806387.1 hypothetical protein H9Q71_009044 [Fusarium xylarioides]
MVRSLSDESEHDGIGRWFDNDDESVQSPQQIPIGEDQDAKEIPVDVGSPKEMLAYLNDFQQKTEEVRLLQPVTDVPSVLSVPSLNLSDETISCSCSLRSFRNATSSSADDETATLKQRRLSIAEYGYDEDAQDAASDSSSDRSGSLSPASCPSPSNTNITSPGSDGSYQDSVDSFEDMPGGAYEPFPTEIVLGSDLGYGSDPEANYSDQHDQPRDADDDDNGEANESTRQEEPTTTEIGSTTETSALVQHKDQPPKRAAGDDENEHQQVSRAKKSKRQEDSHLRLACPFYKHDPIQYRRCHSHVLKRNSYVKQHLFRCHMQPIHCDICLSTWPTAEELREHRRAQVCERREYIAPDGITPEQERKLRSRLGGPNKSESDQWFDIYSIIFPNTERPKSAYLNGELSEDAESLREFMEGRGTNLIMEQLIMSGLITSENNSSRETERNFQGSVQNALRTMFEGWQNRREGAVEDDGGRQTKRLKPTPREFPYIMAQTPVRTDTGSTTTTATMPEDQLEGEQIGPTTSSPQQTGEIVHGLWKSPS